MQNMIAFFCGLIFLSSFACADEVTTEFQICSGEFMCDDYDCIPSMWRCDSQADCEDGSDEENCEEVYHFKCESGGSILRIGVCNGEIDCMDDSDEKFCMAENCTGFFCVADKNCIGGYHKCDFDQDCSDGSDENDCGNEIEKRLAAFCDRESHFICGNICHPKSFLCDGDGDCLDGSDENNCVAENCTGFFCVADKKCISADFKCNFDQDCSDSSDENDCGNEIMKMLASCDMESHFTCGNSCFPKYFLCDDDRDCLDGSDENNCGNDGSTTDVDESTTDVDESTIDVDESSADMDGSTTDAVLAELDRLHRLRGKLFGAM